MSPQKNKLRWPWVNQQPIPKYDPSIPWPRISIITPSFNQGQYIEETIQSVLLQNYPNLEYIIIDGGSTDNTCSILKKYDDRITYWVSEKDNGQTEAINKGLAKSTAEITTWLNSDDLLVEGVLYEVARAFLANEDVHFIYGDGYFLEEPGLRVYNNIPEAPSYAKRLGSFPYMQPSCFMRAKVFETVGFLDDTLQMCMDYDLFVRIALYFQMKKINIPLSIFRVHPQAKTYRYNDQWEMERVKILSTILRSFKVPQHKLTLLRAIACYIPNKQTYLTKNIDVDIDMVLYEFLKDSIKFNYSSLGDFQRTFQLTNWIRNNLSKHFSSPITSYYWRSLFFRFFPRLHALLKKIRKGLT